VQAANDKQQLQSMLKAIKGLPDALGTTDTLLADNGYFSAASVMACAAAATAPLIAMRREAHHPSLNERFADARSAPENPTPAEAMAHRLMMREGKKLYALRNKSRNRCSASSNRCWAPVSFCYAGSIRCAASGASGP
jgi:hypothetical protein